MPFVTDRHYRQTLTAAMAYRQKAIQDLVFNSNPVSRILRENGMFKPFTGPEIRVPLIIDKLDVQWFTSYDKLDNEPKELLASAYFTPKNLATGFSLSGTERRGNEGRERIIDLYEMYMDNAQESMKDGWEIALHGNGTGYGGRQMVGLGGALPIIPSAGVYGGIDREQHAIWRPSVFDAATDFTSIGVTGWDATTARKIINQIVGMRSRGGRYPKIWIADLASYQAIDAATVAIQRVTRDANGFGVGPAPLIIDTPVGPVQVYCATGVDNVMPANTIYFIDPDGLEIRYMANYNMVPLFDGDGAQPVNQDAMAQYLLWVGEMVLRNPRFSGRLIATPTDS